MNIFCIKTNTVISRENLKHIKQKPNQNQNIHEYRNIVQIPCQRLKLAKTQPLCTGFHSKQCLMHIG